jgi:hypothetical protein
VLARSTSQNPTHEIPKQKTHPTATPNTFDRSIDLTTEKQRTVTARTESYKTVSSHRTEIKFTPQRIGNTRGIVVIKALA